MTNSPCWTETDGECKRRYAGCHSECHEYKDWLIVHAQEKEQMYKAKGSRIVADNFEAERVKRDRSYYHEVYEKTRRRKRNGD